MNLTIIAKRVEKFVIDNSPGILTAIGVTGTLTTAYLTGTASFKAADILIREQRTLNNKARAGEPPHTLEFKENVKLVWKLYIPASGTCIFTIVCIVFANRIGMRRAAAVAAAFSISEKAFVEYKEKVVDEIGKNKEQKVRDDLAQDRVNQNPVNNREVIITGDGKVLCYEALTGRYFKSSVEELKKAQNDVNFQILHDSYATLSDFYYFVGLPKTSTSNEIGWKSNNLIKMLELEFSAVLSEDGQPCISIDYNVAPVRDSIYRLKE